MWGVRSDCVDKKVIIRRCKGWSLSKNTRKVVDSKIVASTDTKYHPKSGEKQWYPFW